MVVSIEITSSYCYVNITRNFNETYISGSRWIAVVNNMNALVEFIPEYIIAINVDLAGLLYRFWLPAFHICTYLGKRFINWRVYAVNVAAFIFQAS